MEIESEKFDDRRMRLRGCLFLLVSSVVILAVFTLAKPFLKYPNYGPEVIILRRGAASWNAWRADNPATLHFERSNLSGIDLNGADLAWARFYDLGEVGSNLSGTLLRGAELSDARMSYSLLNGADLSGADFHNASFDCSELVGASLAYADGRKSRLNEANLSNADLRGCNLSEATLSWANLAGAKLAGADLTGAYLANANFSGVEDWSKIKSIKCANVYGVDAPFEFRKWALDHGALEYEGDYWAEWELAREACMEAIEESGD